MKLPWLLRNSADPKSIFNSMVRAAQRAPSTKLTLKAIESVATVQAYHLATDWGSRVGAVQVVLAAIGFVYEFNDEGLRQPMLSCSGSAPWPSSPTMYSKGGGDASRISIAP